MAPPLQTLTSLVNDDTMEKAFIMDEDERPKVAFNQFSDDIPVISLAGIDDDRPDGKRDEIRRRVVAACEEWGLFQVVDHGVDAQMVRNMSDLAKEFFALPDEEKLKFDMSGGKKGGFIVSSHIQNERVANWRETMNYVTYPIKERDYSRWPNKPVEWADATKAYSEKLMDLAYKLLEVLSEAMGLDKDTIAKTSREMVQKMVVNYYPTCPRPDLALGLKRHTDKGSITLLLQDQVGGLQATKDDGNTWITVKPIEGAFVVNLGDYAYYLSNGRFKSADHQAVVNTESTRMSIATFIYPDEKATTYPLKVEEGTQSIVEKPMTFAEMYKSRMIFHLEQSKLKELAKEKKFQKEDIEKFIKNCGDKAKTIKELLA